jgi:Carboxypeptidase regulatory-like domain
MRRGSAAILILAVALTACASNRGSSGSSSGVRGTVLAGPQCPVERAGSPCPDAPVADAEVRAMQGGDVAGTDRTDADGRFEIALPPGRYEMTVHLGSGAFGSVKPVDVTVSADGFATANLSVDTGIR